MNLNEIRTGIRTLPGFGPEETVEILASMTARYPAQSKYSRALIDCFTEIQGCIEEDALDTRPADESWRARQETPLAKAFGFGEAFDALAKLSVRAAMLAAAAPEPVSQYGSPELQELIVANLTKPSPFKDCQFLHCDLPGQCISEGKCHHPRNKAALEPKP